MPPGDADAEPRHAAHPVVSDGRARVLVSQRPPGAEAVALLESAAQVSVRDGVGAMPRGELLAAVAGVDALYCMLADSIDEELLDAAPRLRVVSTMSVGTDNVDLDACARRGIAVGNTPGVLDGTVADTAIGLLLAAARRLVEGVDHVRAGRWKAWDPDLLWGQDVHGSTVGIVGFGGVGRAIARRLSGFDCTVLIANRTPRPEEARALGVEEAALEDLLRRSDHVVVSVALTADTRHLIDAVALALMKPTATLVNVSRGPVVDQAALEQALRDGVIGAAGLDVTDPEPMGVGDPLLTLPNCVVIPHLGSSTRRTREAMAVLAARNIVAFLRGEEMPARVV